MADSRTRTQPDNALLQAAAALLDEAGVRSGSSVCVALSGGVDSVVLLDLLASLQSRFGYELSAAHVNHGLSPNADAWQSFCRRLCADRGLACRCLRVGVDRNSPAGVEAAARHARHAALDRLQVDWLALGHHQDDQAETLLFRLLRGTGVRGAGAMRPADGASPTRPGRLRPLLDARRQTIVAHARTRGLAWIEDESNADPRFTRNCLRHDIFPALEQVFPAAVPTLARAAAHFREADTLLQELAAIDRTACGGDRLMLDRMLSLSDARVRNLLRAELQRAGANPPAQARLDEAVRQLHWTDGGPLRLPLGGGLACCVYRGRVWMARDAGACPLPVKWGGQAELPWGDTAVGFEPTDGRGLSWNRLERADEVVLTPRWEGLKIRLAAARPRRSFKNLCQENGVPSWLRSELPVLRVDGEAAWIAEIGISIDFACGPAEPGLLPRWRR